MSCNIDRLQHQLFKPITLKIPLFFLQKYCLTKRFIQEKKPLLITSCAKINLKVRTSLNY